MNLYDSFGVRTSHVHGFSDCRGLGVCLLHDVQIVSGSACASSATSETCAAFTHARAIYSMFVARCARLYHEMVLVVFRHCVRPYHEFYNC